MIFSQNTALASLFERYGEQIASEECLDSAIVRSLIEHGKMVFLGNPKHENIRPILVGQPSRVKVNANIGTSPLCDCPQTELKKLKTALDAGADTVMDLSISGDLDGIRKKMLSACSAPVGTVPMYAVGQKILDADGDVADMDPAMLFAEVETQAKQGVDFMTLHCGLTRRGAEWAAQEEYGMSRVMGIVSRGGSMLARWMLHNNRENPLLEGFDKLIDIARAYNVTLSLGDGLRPGAGVDAGDSAQWEEVITLGRLAARALDAGVQCMIEGPGHVAMNQVEAQITGIKRLTNGSPLYVLGPLVTDTAAGYDHIAGAIGGAIAVRAGVDFLCYLTPAEHLTLPDEQDVRLGVMASRIAAQAGETAMGRPAAVRREADMNRARKALDWEGMKNAALDPLSVERRREPHRDHEECAMCGKFCAVKMLRDAKKGTEANQ
ncbi:MAG: phosphomethylpyrimidine synthase ThiC [Desulfovibrionaceae bacterium]|nr:phosphomethylpyrimidine synthase ThiC [Desulfovibrionaceae bacterium]